MTSVTAEARTTRKVRVGIVTSNKMMKTIVVRVQRLVRHPTYNRVITRATSFKAHDETNSAGVGDWVKIMETRPLSKDKRWRLVEILRRASSAPAVPIEEEIEGQARAKARAEKAAASGPAEATPTA